MSREWEMVELLATRICETAKAAREDIKKRDEAENLAIARRLWKSIAPLLEFEDHEPGEFLG